MTALGRSVLVVNDSIIAKEFFDKRGKNYSHRPQTTMAGELIGLSRVSEPSGLHNNEPNLIVCAEHGPV